MNIGFFSLFSFLNLLDCLGFLSQSYDFVVQHLHFKIWIFTVIYVTNFMAYFKTSFINYGS